MSNLKLKFSDMKKAVFLFVFIVAGLMASAQLKSKSKCADFYVDLLDGKVNGMKPNYGYEELKAKFPCFTSTDPESGSAKCGGTIAFKDHDITFFTTKDYVEIGEKFKGKLSIPLIGAKRGSLFQYLGNPKMKDDTWDAYTTNYGVLIVYYNKANKINKIQFSTNSTDTISLCE